jgi:hypothetical protein
MNPLRQRMFDDMQIRNFAPGTQQAYIRAMANFAKHFGRSPDQLGPDEIRAYQVHLVQERQVGWGVFNTTVSALRFFYRTTLEKDWCIDLIPFPHREKKLPGVLSADEVQRFFASLFMSPSHAGDRLCGGLARLRGGAPSGHRHRQSTDGHQDSTRLRSQGPLRNALAMSAGTATDLVESSSP